MTSIRPLIVADAVALHEIRLAAVADDPIAFCATLEEEQQRSVADYAEEIVRDRFFGAFNDGRLVGIMAYAKQPYQKRAHKAELRTVFIHPDYRGKGIAKKLIQTILADAKTHLEIMTLTVATISHDARKLYVSEGFQSYGIEPRNQKIGSDYFDEEYMWLDLSRWQPSK